MARKPSSNPFITAPREKVILTPELIAGFVETFLIDTFDESKHTPKFHLDFWRLLCLPARRVAIAAPRGHAKSTAGSLSYALAAALFGQSDFLLLISATEDLVKPHLANIKFQLIHNEYLVEAFNIEVLKDNETELIARTNEREFCIIAKGAEQKLRGSTWRQKRPGLILIDDLEDDEQVMSPMRREKLRRWFNNAVLPVGSDSAKFRMFGTILHMDSLLERLLSDSTWTSKRFSAHEDFDDFSNILWPEKFTVERLREERQSYINAGNASGYSQEYLSYPVAEEDAYFKRDYFLPMLESDFALPKNYFVAVDFAISQSERADRTAIVVGGVCPNNILHIEYCWAEKGDGMEIIEALFNLEKRFHPELWIFENGQISKSLGPFLNAEMIKRNLYLNIRTVTPTKDKKTRARSIQKRMQAGGVRFNIDSDWYPPLFNEATTFDRGAHDDRVDALAYLGLYLDKFYQSETLEQLQYTEYEEEVRATTFGEGRSPVTGY